VTRRGIMIRRRSVLTGAGLLGLAAAPAGAQQLAAAAQSLERRVTDRARENRHVLNYDGRAFSGPAWDLLVDEGRQAQVTMIGEEHGIAENPRLAAQLFRALVPAGYSKVAVEISPPMAAALDGALTTSGLDGLRRMFREPTSTPAFFGMREEAEWLAAARAAVPGRRPFLWGFDYEVGGYPLLVARLQARPVPAAARAPLAALSSAVGASWARYQQTHDPRLIPSFALDPALARAVRSTWVRPDPEAEVILATLEETLEINRLFFANRNWESNDRRARLMRANLFRYWRAEKAAGRAPKLFCKFGASHVTRGRNYSEVMDFGTALHELAELEGGHAFSVLVLPGDGAETAAFDPAAWTYKPRKGGKDDYAAGLDPLLAATDPVVFTLIDLRPIRPLLSAARTRTAHPELMRIVHGFDAVLVLNGSKPSTNL
jgi:erythromycin esterase-like protein